mmetsp:Transcript_19217/g.17037  ORF Transcript_19217/g.17037 Transcript_19217/m.17037 type:complete len:211 (-) Transcript_19217:47-679(-)
MEKGSPLSYTPTVAVKHVAPDFEATAYQDYEFKKVKLSDYRGKYVLLVFWPMDFSFVCPTEIIAFSEAAKIFREHNTEVLGISCDSHFTHMEFAMKPKKKGGLGDIDIPLLSDKSHNISKAFGCYIDHGDYEGCAFRATYIMDKEGIVRHSAINDTQVGRSPDEFIRLVQAFQFSDEKGEVCPAKWTPGSLSYAPKLGGESHKKFLDNYE